jgi:hypothetical protein
MFAVMPIVSAVERHSTPVSHTTIIQCGTTSHIPQNPIIKPRLEVHLVRVHTQQDSCISCSVSENLKISRDELAEMKAILDGILTLPINADKYMDIIPCIKVIIKEKGIKRRKREIKQDSRAVPSTGN